MSQPPNFEIPPGMRGLAETSVEQSRQAYNQFSDAVRRAQDLMARSSDAMATSARGIHERAMQYTAQNMEANFAFARELARARDFQEVLAMQQSFAQRQMMTYGLQAQELTRLLAEAAARAQPKI